MSAAALILSMRTNFGAGVTAASFAEGMLRTAQASIAHQIRRGQPVAIALRSLLDLRLSDRVVRGRDVAARIEHGRWLADCECGGAEYVDLVLPILCCCSCWNRADGHQWRRVELPDRESRAEIERLLLIRPDSATR